MSADIAKLCKRVDEYKTRTAELKKAPELTSLLRLSCRVDIQESIRRGIVGAALIDNLCYVTINLADLTEEDRQLLASCVTDQLEF